MIEVTRSEIRSIINLRQLRLIRLLDKDFQEATELEPTKNNVEIEELAMSLAHALSELVIIIKEPKDESFSTENSH